MENKSKNYKILQKIAELGKILSKVAFVFSVIGICGCIVGILSNVIGNGKIFMIDGVTIHGILSDFNAYNVKSISAVLTAWLIICTGEAVLSKFSEIYFRNTLAEGTPFTQMGARELRRLGIMTMVIPTGCMVLAEIVQGIMTGLMNVSIDAWSNLNFDNESSVVLGIMFIIGSFLCGYGAEFSEKKNIAQNDN